MSDLSAHSGPVPQVPTVECSACGSTNATDRATCWSCQGPLAGAHASPSVTVRPDQQHPAHPQHQPQQQQQQQQQGFDQHQKRARESMRSAKNTSKSLKRTWYRGARTLGKARRIIGSGAVVLAALVALVPGVRSDVGDRFDGIYSGMLERLGQLPKDAVLSDVTEASSSLEGSDASFAADGSLATGWAPAADDPEPKLVIRLPQRPEVTYVELSVSGATAATSIRADFVDLALTGTPVIVAVEQFVLDTAAVGLAAEPQRFRVKAKGVDQLELKITGAGATFLLREVSVLGGT